MSDQQWTPPGSDGQQPWSTPPGAAQPPPQQVPPSPAQQYPPPPPTYAGAPGSVPPTGPQPGPGGPGGWGAPPPQGPPPGWGVAGAEFRPGVIPLRPLALGDLYGALTRTIRGNAGATIGLALLTTLVFLVPFTALGAWVGSQVDPAGFDPYDPDVGGEGTALLGTLATTYIPSLGTALSSLVLAGFVAWVVGQAVLGRRVTAGETWAGTRGRLLALLGAAVLSGLATLVLVVVLLVGPVLLLVTSDGRDGMVAGGIILLLFTLLLAVLGGLWLWTRLAFVSPVIVVERTGIGRGFARSWALTRGSTFWRVLGIRLLTAVMVAIAAQVLAIPIGLILGGALLAVDPQYVLVVQAVTVGLSGLVSGALTTPFTAGLDALLYVDQRIRLEGYDVDLVRAAGGTPPAG